MYLKETATTEIYTYLHTLSLRDGLACCFHDVPAQGLGQFGQGPGSGRPGGKGEGIAVAVARHAEDARLPRAEADGGAPAHQHLAARQRGMAAELDLHGRREPAPRIARLRKIGRASWQERGCQYV